MILTTLLDQVIELLENPQFKNFGDLQKSKFQNSKTEEEKWLISEMHKNKVIDPKSTKKRLRSMKKKGKKWKKKVSERTVASRKATYKDPERLAKYKEAIKKRDLNPDNLAKLRAGVKRYHEERRAKDASEKTK